LRERERKAAADRKKRTLGLSSKPVENFLFCLGIAILLNGITLLYVSVVLRSYQERGRSGLLSLALSGAGATWFARNGSTSRHGESVAQPWAKRLLRPLALIWNVLTACLFVRAYSTDGWVSILPATAVGIIALIGLAVTAAQPREFLSMLNPYITATFEPGEVCVGGAGRICWTLHPSFRRFSKLRIAIVGAERVQLPQGQASLLHTRQHHVYSEFERIMVFETPAEQDMVRGRVDFAIPERTMPTWRSPHKRIYWRILFHGEVVRGPDLRQVHDLTVLPYCDKGDLP